MSPHPIDCIPVLSVWYLTALIAVIAAFPIMELLEERQMNPTNARKWNGQGFGIAISIALFAIVFLVFTVILRIVKRVSARAATNLPPTDTADFSVPDPTQTRRANTSHINVEDGQEWMELQSQSRGGENLPSYDQTLLPGYTPKSGEVLEAHNVPDVRPQEGISGIVGGRRQADSTVATPRPELASPVRAYIPTNPGSRGL